MLIDHAKRELELMGECDLVVNSVLELITVFAKQGHSGSSAPHCASLFEHLAGYGILTPLTGEDEEWCEVREGLSRNKRASHVFRDESTGEVYDMDGVVFVDENGSSFTSTNSKVPVVFPYTPKTKVVYSDEKKAIEEISDYLHDQQDTFNCDISAAVFYDTEEGKVQCFGAFKDLDKVHRAATALELAAKKLKEKLPTIN